MKKNIMLPAIAALAKIATWPVRAWKNRGLLTACNTADLITTPGGLDANTSPWGEKGYLADAALSYRYLFVKFGTDWQHVAVTTAITDVPLGIATDVVATADLTSSRVAVRLLSSAMRQTELCVASAAIAVGDLICATASGYAVTYAAGNAWIVGVALSAATASGQVIEFCPRPYYKAA